jgi:acid phosphatase family membrane protein YuiD
MISILQDTTWVPLLRTDALTTYFKLYIILGQPAFYVFGFALWFWLKGNKEAIYFVFAAILSTVLNSLIKMTFKIPRPPVENFLVNASSFGFPSGDVQIVATTLFLVSLYYRSRLFALLAALITINVMGSRLYLGVHSPLDVMVGALVGITTAFILNSQLVQSTFNQWYLGKNLRSYWAMCTVATGLSLFLFLDVIGHTLATGLGAMFGLGIAFRNGNLNKMRKSSLYLVSASSTFLAILFLILPNTMISGDMSWINQVIKYFIITLYVFYWAPMIFDAIRKDKELRRI